MAVSPAQMYAAPFDAIAGRYDETFTTSRIGLAQRASVWKKLDKVFSRNMGLPWLPATAHLKWSPWRLRESKQPEKTAW